MKTKKIAKRRNPRTRRVYSVVYLAREAPGCPKREYSTCIVAPSIPEICAAVDDLVKFNRWELDRVLRVVELGAVSRSR